MTFDRRRFLTSVLAGSALAALGSPVGARKARPLGLQLYTLRSELAKDFEGTLARVAELGFEEVELFNLFGHSATEVRAMLDRCGLVAPSTHTLMKPLRDHLSRLIDECHTLGHRYLVVAFLLPDERSLDHYRRHLDVLRTAAPICRAAGLRLGYHNHDFEFTSVAGIVPYDLIMDSTTSEELVLELDLYWVSKAGVDPLSTVHRAPERFPMVHVKDMANTAEREFIEVGSGVIDFAKILRAPEARSIEHYYVEQDTIVGPIWKSVEKSLAGLRTALG